MNKHERLDEHQKFRELAALAQRGALTDSERLALDRHLAFCLACQEAHAEFALISAEGMPLLAAAYGQGDAAEDWDEQLGRSQVRSFCFALGGFKRWAARTVSDQRSQVWL